MKQKIFGFIIILLFTVTTVFSQNVGEIAPNFTLKTLGNQDYTLSANRGDVIFVFLVGNTCPLCIASAPTVKSKILNTYRGYQNFQSLIIDTWDGSSAAVQGFKSTTGMSGTYLLNGSSVAKNWSTTYDRLVVIDDQGKMVFKGTSAASNDADAASAAISAALDKVTGISEIGNTTALQQNFPNPCSGKTTIEFYLAKPGVVKIAVYDVTGRMVSMPVNNYKTVGIHQVKLDVSDFKRGIYLYRLEVGEHISMKKMIVN